MKIFRFKFIYSIHLNIISFHFIYYYLIILLFFVYYISFHFIYYYFYFIIFSIIYKLFIIYCFNYHLYLKFFLLRFYLFNFLESLDFEKDWGFFNFFDGAGGCSTSITSMSGSSVGSDSIPVGSRLVEAIISPVTGCRRPTMMPLNVILSCHSAFVVGGGSPDHTE